MPFRDFHDYPAYVSAAERRLRAQRQLKALAKRGLAPEPVAVEGRDLATTFWGRAWNDHLESHADLMTRLPRGRSYLRAGAVLDLKIARGEIRAFVSGTDLYEVTIRLATLAPARWRAVRAACAGRIATVVELLSGRLSASVMGVLCDRKTGLFPAPAELDLRCSCPDAARLCKHLAAVLYGVGAKLDASPELLFTLRGVELEALVADASGAGASEAFTGPAGAATIPEDRLAEIFGIALETGPAKPPRKARAPAKKPRKAAAKAKAAPRSRSRPRGRARRRASR